MKSLKEYLNKNLKTKYVAVIYDDETQENLRNYCEKNGFDITVDYDGEPQNPEDFDFHSTIFFTTSKHDIKNGETTFDFPKSVNAIKFEFLGHNGDIPVIKVMSDDLQELLTYYETEYGMEDEWPEWKPHISLSYAGTNLPDIDNIELPDFPLTFQKLVIEDGKPDE